MSTPNGARNGVPQPRRPAGLTVAAVIVLLEALAIAAVAVASFVQAPGSAYPIQTFGVGGTALVTALLLVAVATGLFRGSAWSRTAAIVWQLVQLLVGAYAFQGQGAQPVAGLVALVPALLALVLLLTRPVRDATARG